MQKHCSGCDQSKPIDQFRKKPRHAHYPDSLAGYASVCFPCDKAARKQYRINNLGAYKSSDRTYRLNRYGLTAVDYNRMFEAQAGKCLGCARHQSELPKTLAVDHNHETGQVRGLLCVSCNVILGHAKDAKSVLVNLCNYLINSELAGSNTNVVGINTAKKVG